LMCEAFSTLGHEVMLLAARSVSSQKIFKEEIKAYYGVNLKNVNLVSYYWSFSKGLNIVLGFFSFFSYFLLRIKKWYPDFIISRNLYASFLLRPLIAKRLYFETHQLESGWRRLLQKVLVEDKRVIKIFISSALRCTFEKQFPSMSFPSMVLHDAAPSGNFILSREKKHLARLSLFPKNILDKYKMICGYFGHLYQGRGIEIIVALAKRYPGVAFLVYGGNEAQVSVLKKAMHTDNFMIMGHVNFSIVKNLMSMFDVLLMPYQRQVSIGDKRSDTSQWMSPMKMFEYMASGVPFIASRLPVLEEVLCDGENCLLALPNDINDWSSCLQRLCDNPELGERLALKAYSEYLSDYNWLSRANKILQFVKE